MKKILLSFMVVSVCLVTASGQTRMTLHEEFTGENCGPCAATNPGFWSLCDGSGNPSKLIHISYMVPIPSAGFYCNRTADIYTRMLDYYAVPFAPYGRYDGHVPDPSCGSPAGSSGGHPGCFVQADIDAEAAIPAKFNISVTNAWSTNFDSVAATITVTCVTADTGTFYLRTVLAETNNFATSPGSNGETHFENVVQAMYPDTLGTVMAGTWAAGSTHTYTVKGAVPSYVDKSGSPYIVCWIQNDVDQSIHQAAQAAPLPSVANDAAITAVATTSPLVCVANGPYSLGHTVTLKNSGSTTLTSATIYYSIDGGTLLTSPWTGSLATGATASVTMPVYSLTVAGALYHSVFDSVAKPNGATDYNLVNNAGGQSVFIESTTALGLPYSTSFETADLGKFDMIAVNTPGATWGIYDNGTGASLAHTGTNAALYDCYDFNQAVVGVMTLPEVASGTDNVLTFYTSHCEYTAASPENDSLEVVYSTDCGSTWTSLWLKSGTSLANLPVSTSPFTPTSSQYVEQTVSLSTVPAGAILGLRGTSDFGNNIWVDDINIRSTTSVGQVNPKSVLTGIYPNPATDVATLSLNLINAGDVQISVTDETGRIIYNQACGKMDAGIHLIPVNTSAFSAGIYTVVIKTESGICAEKLGIVK